MPMAKDVTVHTSLSPSHCIHTFIVIIFVLADINECGGENGCTQVCNNTDGSFQCSCFSGYTLNADGVSCHSKRRKK